MVFQCPSNKIQTPYSKSSQAVETEELMIHKNPDLSLCFTSLLAL